MVKQLLSLRFWWAKQRIRGFWKDKVVKAMFIERKICTELMERRYEICKAASTVSAAHKPLFLHVFEWYSQETGTVQCALSPLPGHFLRGKTTWRHTSRTAVSWLVLKGWIWYKKVYGWRYRGRPATAGTVVHIVQSLLFSSLAGSCAYIHLLTLHAISVIAKSWSLTS